MNEFVYKLNDNGILLYKIENGNRIPIEKFDDREDLLIYIEEQGFSKIYVLEEEN